MAVSATEQAFWLVVVAACWGCTNPLLRRGSLGVEKIQREGRVAQVLGELGFLVTRPQYVIPFLLNQLGSVLFYQTLGQADLSLAVPLSNSLTFLFSVGAGRLLGEPPRSPRTYAGLGCIAIGSCICVMSK